MYLISCPILPYDLYLVSWPILLYGFFTSRLIKLSFLLRNDFPTAIFELPKLKILNVTSNTNLTGFFPEFHNNSLLEHVNLTYIDFFRIVPESISNLNHSILLSLTLNSFFRHIPNSFSNFTQYTALGLY